MIGISLFHAEADLLSLLISDEFLDSKCLQGWFAIYMGNDIALLHI